MRVVRPILNYIILRWYNILVAFALHFAALWDRLKLKMEFMIDTYVCDNSAPTHVILLYYYNIINSFQLI